MVIPGAVRWRLKCATQIGLSLVPFGDNVNHLMQRCNGAYTNQRMLRNYHAQMYHIKKLNDRFPLKDRCILEIGPGWFARAAVIFWLAGAGTIFLIDVGKHLRLSLVKRWARVLMAHGDLLAADLGLDAVDVASKLGGILNCRTLEDVLTLTNCVYLAPADARSSGLPKSSVDLVFSYGVLEHIPEDVLHGILEACKSILVANGRCFHNVGLHDHFQNAGLGNGVNFLRYSDLQWRLIAGNRFAYHNRCRKSDYLEMISKAGAMVTYLEETTPDINYSMLKSLPLASRFRGYSTDDLACNELIVEFSFT